MGHTVSLTDLAATLSQQGMSSWNLGATGAPPEAWPWVRKQWADAGCPPGPRLPHLVGALALLASQGLMTDHVTSLHPHSSPGGAIMSAIHPLLQNKADKPREGQVLA